MSSSLYTGTCHEPIIILISLQDKLRARFRGPTQTRWRWDDIQDPDPCPARRLKCGLFCPDDLGVSERTHVDSKKAPGSPSGRWALGETG